MKTFTVGPVDPNAQPIEFALAGTYRDGKQIEQIVLNALPEIQGWLLEAMLGATSPGAETEGLTLCGYIEQCLPAEDTKKFVEVTRSKDILVDVGTLGDIVAYLSEEYSKRPFARQGSLLDGRMKTDGTSRQGAPPPVLPTPEAFAQATT